MFTGILIVADIILLRRCRWICGKKKKKKKSQTGKWLSLNMLCVFAC